MYDRIIELIILISVFGIVSIVSHIWLSLCLKNKSKNKELPKYIDNAFLIKSLKKQKEINNDN